MMAVCRVSPPLPGSSRAPDCSPRALTRPAAPPRYRPTARSRRRERLGRPYLMRRPRSRATLRPEPPTRGPFRRPRPAPAGRIRQRHPQRYGCERASAPGIASRPTGGYEQCLLAFDGCACGAHRQRRADSCAKPLDSVLVVLRPSVVGDCGGKSPRHPYVVSGARCMGRRTPPRVCAAHPMTVSPCRRRP